jgi:hypothetical protein
LIEGFLGSAHPQITAWIGSGHLLRREENYERVAKNGKGGRKNTFRKRKASSNDLRPCSKKSTPSHLRCNHGHLDENEEIMSNYKGAPALMPLFHAHTPSLLQD